MPVSEDEFERPLPMAANQSAMSKAEQRKSNKPIMEKRRRARINHCLNELKTLILDAMKKDPARHSKLEKADILEMTVKHLQQIQRQQLATAVATDPAVIMRFKSGFDECAAEVSRYIGRLEGVDNGVKQRLTAHLHRCVSSIQQVSALPHQMFSSLGQNCDKSTIILPNAPVVPGDVNNNSNQNAERIQIPSGLHLIPSRLPTGELALLVPNSNHASAFVNVPPGSTFQFPQNTSITMNALLSPTLTLNPSAHHSSAFTAVSKTQDYPSPTSTADIVKKEMSSPDADEYKAVPFSSTTNDRAYLQNYKSYKATDVKENGGNSTEDENIKKMSGHETIDSSRKYEQFRIKPEGVEREQKISQRPCSSSFQRTVADSTTSFVQPKEPETAESGFQPFQVEIPNCRLKAHISISESVDIRNCIHQKPNPNFTLNPNKNYQKSPHKFPRTPENNFPEIGFEKFLKIEPLTIVTEGEKAQDGNEGISDRSVRPTSSSSSASRESTTQRRETQSARGFKRPMPNSCPELASPSSSEPPDKAPKISLNVTLTEGRSPSQEDDSFGNRCKRISVIVEDSSKSGSGRETKSEVTVNVSSQKDMWRPW